MALEPIVVETIVKVSQRAAFVGFTARFAEWWPLHSHSVSAARGGPPPQSLIIEPWVGGRLLETGADGEGHLWGSVRVWDEFSALVFDWHVGRSAALATRVSVTFAMVDDGRTAITLVHDNWEVLGAEGAAIHARNAGGWSKLIGELFKTYVERGDAAAVPIR
ncbi:SRPBCC domain-containing protein [Devosia sp.]|uniref:SRPBCC domain-containing protein n=1 Tax=Devosia sp. TaxID=1871048 RepID=UPI003A8FEBAC